MNDKEQKLKYRKCKHYQGMFNSYANGLCYMFKEMITGCKKFERRK